MSAPPVHWPRMTGADAVEEWDELRLWVVSLFHRYPNGVRLPDCWWRHADIVELLAALRDHERGSFAPSAAATSAIEWQRAFRDVEDRLELWIKRLPCSVAGRGHSRSGRDERAPEGWSDFVQADVRARLAMEGSPDTEPVIPDVPPI